MTSETMTSRQRILASVRGDEVDRFPVWLKMDNGTWQGSQPEPYRSMGSRELLTACGCDLIDWVCANTRSRNLHTEMRDQRRNGSVTQTIDTPDGPLVKEYGVDPVSGWHPTKYMVETAEDLAAVRWLFKDTSYTVEDGSPEAARRKQQQCETDGVLTCTGLGPSPLMNLVEDICGPENANYLAFDEPELFDEVVELMHAEFLRHLDVFLPIQVADTCWLTENTSTTLISPGQFAKYCGPHLRDYGQRIVDHDIIAVHHMCGALNVLLEEIDALPAQVNEAYTTSPLGDVSLADGRRRMPSKALWGGTNATLWLEAVETIVRTVDGDLGCCRAGVAENVAAVLGCDLEGLKETAEAAQESIQLVESIESTLTNKVGHTQAVGFSPLADLLKEMQVLLAAQLVRRGVGVAEGEAEGAGRSVTGEVNSREDVMRVLDKACDYFRRHEPSSPVPMLLKRAKKLMSKEFLEIVRDLAPGGVQEVEKIRGPDAD